MEFAHNWHKQVSNNILHNQQKRPELRNTLRGATESFDSPQEDSWFTVGLFVAVVFFSLVL